MSQERGGLIFDYYARTKPENPKLSPIDIATQGQLGFDRSLLPPRNGSPSIEVGKSRDGTIIWCRERNFGGANTDFYRTKLGVGEEGLSNAVITPSVIEMQSQAVLTTKDGKDFAGYTGNELIYWRGGFDDRLQQGIRALHIPSRVSPIFETVSIQRYVLDRIGDCTYGQVIFNAEGKKVTERLGVRPDGSPVFLAFTPEYVLATTYGSTVLGQFSYEQVREAGYHLLKIHPR